MRGGWESEKGLEGVEGAETVYDDGVEGGGAGEGIVP